MKEISREALERVIELACYLQICIRRARMEPSLTVAHIDRLGEGVKAAERIEEIGRRVLSGRMAGNDEWSDCEWTVIGS